MKIRRVFINTRALIALAFVLLGCKGVSVPTGTTTLTAEALISTTPAGTAAVTFTPPMTKTSVAAFSSTPTQTPTGTPTWTPRPTFTLEEAQLMVQELRQTNGGCQYPCYWGIIPGKSPWFEVEAFHKTFAWKIGKAGELYESFDYLLYWTYFPISDSPSAIESMVIRFYVGIEDRLVKIILAGTDYPLTDFLKTFGAPYQIWSWASGIPETGPTVYALTMFYPDRGILAGIEGYSDLIVKEGKDYLSLCQEDLLEDEIWVTVWSPEERKDFEEIGREVRLFGPPGYEVVFRPLAEMSNMSVEAFYQAFNDPETIACLEVPMESWY